LAIPFIPAFRFPALATTPRKRRNIGTESQRLLGSQVYIDAIGISRGVPNKFKARNQIATGFESVPF
jgi:hypothetical protein